jgi:hypothetical protein
MKSFTNSSPVYGGSPERSEGMGAFVAPPSDRCAITSPANGGGVEANTQ